MQIVIASKLAVCSESSAFMQIVKVLSAGEKRCACVKGVCDICKDVDWSQRSLELV